MSTLTTEARQISLDTVLDAEQIPALRAESGTNSCWMVTGDKLMVQVTTPGTSADFSGFFTALFKRGVQVTGSLLVSKMVLAA